METRDPRKTLLPIGGRDLTLGRTPSQREAVRELQALLEVGLVERLRRTRPRAA